MTSRENYLVVLSKLLMGDNEPDLFGRIANSFKEVETAEVIVGLTNI